MTFNVCAVCSAFILDVDKHAAWHQQTPTFTVSLAAPQPCQCFACVDPNRT